MLKRLLTKNLTQIPLLFINFDYKKYKKEGKNGSCTISMHPSLKDDEYIKNTLKEIVDYIRDAYNLENI